MSYFTAGLWHFAAAMSFAAAFGIIERGDPLFRLAQPAFLVPLLLGACALFFIPDAWAKKGLLKFLHYPLPDWDVLLLGPASHRHWITHSPILPALLWCGAYFYPSMFQGATLSAFANGLCVGIGSHLFWDCVGSRTHKIVIVPYWFALRQAASRVYLLAGAAVSLGIALLFARGTV